MYLYLEEISLGVRAHCSTSDANNESRERVKATTVAWGLRSFSWADSGCSRRCKPAANTPGFDSHPNESSKPKHDSDAYVLYLLGSVRVTRANAKTFHPSIGDAINKNDQRLHKFSRNMFTGR